ncbi:hypothetical protein CGZ94_02175 [Enemella evansiae]|uniref:Peptidase M48 domain-containing protein n=1 Tax=Enemella evansiae TaxID=2016499 RepID=A0A255GWE5_9ACTN|nr:M48 family metallopeptidase [Enemella evansiae]OYO17714.1 hypothetical protein CGZ94_02175 [Enemella evansiae]
MKSVRALLSLLLLVLFPLVVVAALVGVIALTVTVAGRTGSTPFAAKLILVPVLLGVVVAVGEVLRRRPEPPPLPELTRAQHPALWAQVDELAALAQTAPPDRIELSPEVNAAVYQTKKGRSMVIGLPLLATFTVAELRSVLAHELGHFAGGDTAASSRTLRLQVFLRTARDHAGLLLGWFYRLYYRLYLWVSSASRRDAEYAADRLSVRATDPQTAAESFRRLYQVALAWDLVEEEYLPMFPLAGARASIGEALHGVLQQNAEPIRRAADEAIATQRPAWDDSHPPTAQRIQNFRDQPTEPGTTPPDTRPAVLLVGRESLDALEGELLTQDLPLTGWPEVQARAQQVAQRERTGHLLGELRSENVIARPRLADYFALVRNRPDALHPLVSSPDQDGATGLHHLTQGLTLGALAGTPGVHTRTDWRTEVQWFAPDGSPIDLDALTSALIDPNGPPPGQLLPGAPLDQDLVSAEPTAQEAPTAAAMCLRGQGGQFFDLLLYPSGIAVLPLDLPMADRMGAARGKAYHEQRLQQLAGRPREVLLRSLGGQFVPFDRLTDLKVGRGPYRSVRFTVDGTPITLGKRDWSQDFGGAWDALRGLQQPT